MGFTVEGHGEYLEDEVAALGVDLARELGPIGTASMALASSRAGTGEGWLARFGFEHANPLFNIMYRSRLQSREFREIGTTAVHDPVMQRDLASIGVNVTESASLSLAYASQLTWERERTHLIALRQSLQLGRGSISMSAGHSLADDLGPSVFVSYKLRLGRYTPTCPPRRGGARSRAASPRPGRALNPARHCRCRVQSVDGRGRKPQTVLVGITPTLRKARRPTGRPTMRFAIAAILLALPGAAQAMEWRLGASYASGLADVTDLYEENLRLAGFDVDVDLKFPVGIAASFVYDWTRELRTDIGLGPVFLIGGDVEHSEVPLSATIGYSFAPFARISPYIRAGVVHHFASRDQYRSSTPGLFAAVGLEFTLFGIEVATDRSEVEFDRLTCNAAGTDCTLGTATELNTYDVLASVYWRFSLDR